MPQRNSLLSVLAIATVSLGFTPPAISQALLPRMIELDPQNLESQGLALLQDALQLVRFDQYEQALPRVKLATELAPTEFRTWFLLGSIYVQQQEFEPGITALERSLKLVPSSGNVPERPGLLFMLGSAYFQNEQYLDARRVFTAGLAEEDDSVEAWFDLGNTDYRLRNYQDAIAAYEEAVKLESQFWPAINNIGLVHYEQGQVDAAIRQWQAALRVEPEAAEPMLALAIARYRQGQQEEALRIGLEALQLDPSYGDLDFLELNLWGTTLLEHTSQFFALPEIQPFVLKDSPEGVQ